MTPRRHTNNPYNEDTITTTALGPKKKAADDDNMNEISGMTMATTRSLNNKRVAVDDTDSLVSPPTCKKIMSAAADDESLACKTSCTAFPSCNDGGSDPNQIKLVMWEMHENQGSPRKI